MKSHSESYKAAGVDVTAGYKAVELMKRHVERTKIPGLCRASAGSADCSEPNLTGIKQPVLVSGTDGVGNKAAHRFPDGQARHHRHRLCRHVCERRRLLRRASAVFPSIISPWARTSPSGWRRSSPALRKAACSRAVPSSAEKRPKCPAFYPVDEYDLAGFCVGLADREKMIDGSRLQPGDALIGVASSRIRNGFSLVRKVFGINEEKIGLYVGELGKTLGEELLTPTKLYEKRCSPCWKAAMSRRCPTSPAAVSMKTFRGCCSRG